MSAKQIWIESDTNAPTFAEVKGGVFLQAGFSASFRDLLRMPWINSFQNAQFPVENNMQKVIRKLFETRLESSCINAKLARSLSPREKNSLK